jgi:hypothetical protein
MAVKSDNETKRYKKTKKAAQMKFIKSIEGYTLSDHRRNEDILVECKVG